MEGKNQPRFLIPELLGQQRNASWFIMFWDFSQKEADTCFTRWMHRFVFLLGSGPGDSDSCSTLTEHLSEPILPFAPPFCLFSCLHLCFEAFTPPGGSCHESGLSPLQGIFSSLMSQRGSMGCSVCVPNLQPSSR